MDVRRRAGPPPGADAEGRDGLGAPDPSIPWGGNDVSGLGRELGPGAMDDVTRERSAHIYF
ncbi:hypothetical protein GCM10022237_04200 [Nocardioides ginsengisoli]